jgi:hypothetical protein
MTDGLAQRSTGESETWAKFIANQGDAARLKLLISQLATILTRDNPFQERTFRLGKIWERTPITNSSLSRTESMGRMF